MRPARAPGWLLVGLLWLQAAPSLASDPHALWRIVHGGCEPDERAHGSPAPCALVDEAGGYAVLKDRAGREQFLLIPLARIEGIEAPVLRDPGTADFFADAWAHMDLVEQRLGRRLPREDLSVAVNSAYGRSQDQLHLHMDCLRRDVRDRLRALAGGIGPHWASLPGTLAGQRYRALRIGQPTLDAAHDPFRLLARSLGEGERAMGRHTLVLVGTVAPRPGFILLDGEADLLRLDRGAGEDLQDHACAVAGG